MKGPRTVTKMLSLSQCVHFCFGSAVCVKSVTPPDSYIQQDCLVVIKKNSLCLFFKALKSIFPLYEKKIKILASSFEL